MALELQERVSFLEETMDRFVATVDKVLYRNSKTIEALKQDMLDFRYEMRAYRERSEKEMAEFKAEMAASRERSEKEMAEFKAEMRSFRKELGGISNKMGTLGEDLVVPAIRPLITRYFKDELLDISPRRKRRVKSLGIRGEFDVIAVSTDTVYLVDVKSNAEKKDIDTFASTTVPRFKELFPEYEPLKLVLIFASLYLEQETIDYATEKKMYALAYKEWDYMDLLNFEAVSAA